MKKLYIFLTIIILTLSACKNKETVVVQELRNGKPNWFYSPTLNKYKYGGVGVAGRSKKGLSGQRQIAISRAIDELAVQMGVSVDNIVKTEQTDSTSTYESYSVQATTGEVFSAQLMDIWIDENTKELFAWMVIK
jgi:hypothetical protein